MSNNRSLRAFVKYDNAGKIVPSSLILAQSMPKVGRWQEIDAYPTQSPTTTIAPGPLVGSLYLGAGYVTWLDETNRLGNMISTTDLVAPGYTFGAPWAPSNAPNISTGSGFGVGYPFRTGQAATNLIISAYSGYNNNYAAYIARNHNGGGFNDWYFPTYEDINNIMCTDGLITTLNNNGANIMLDTGNIAAYWNALEQTSAGSWVLTPYAGCNTGGVLPKTSEYRVRAIRYFTY